MKKKDHDSQTSDEVKRLGKNWRVLLDMLQEMVFLIREDLVIEYQNPYAIKKLGDLCGKTCTDFLCSHDKRCQEECPVKDVIQGDGSTNAGVLVETRIGDIEIEYNYQPFQGYSTDRMVMIIMRDISKRRAQERELEIFNNNVENILRRKIDELKESETLRRRLTREVNVLKKKVEQNKPGDEIVGSSKKIQDLKDVIGQVADSDATILISGESGTGKELVANMLFDLSRRKEQIFLKVNCSSINENLLESDLFGHEKGAFTGAGARKKGKFEMVDGGTIFLDEIGDISPRMQATLLRVLQNGEIIRVGGTTPVNVDVRILAATNTDLAEAVQNGRFRLDLYYRLNIINITMPSLRERKEDIVELASHFIRQYQKAFKKKKIDFLPSTVIDKLLSHNWPGNVRELENVVQRAVLMARNNTITEQDIIYDGVQMRSEASDYFNNIISGLPESSLKELISKFEADVISHALKETKGNVMQTAGMLDLGKTALYDKMKRYDINGKLWK